MRTTAFAIVLIRLRIALYKHRRKEAPPEFAAMTDRGSGNQQKQYVSTMSEVFQCVKTQWTECGRTIAGERGFAAVHLQSVCKAHPAFPIFVIGLAGCVVCSNGAGLRLWGSLAPIVLWVINCNYPQTRKSGLGAVVEVFAPVADKRVRKTFKALLKLKQAAVGSEAAAAATVPNVQTVSEDDPAVCSLPAMADWRARAGPQCSYRPQSCCGCQ